MRSVIRGLMCAFVSAVWIALSGTAAFADKTTLSVSTQLGINYLPMTVMRHDRLIEKHAAALGLGDISVTLVKLSGAAATSDALLSGSVDFAATGIPPIIQMWSATAGGKNGIKAIGALASLPFLLNTTNPNVKAIGDFTDQDRIAVPAAKVGLQATLLQMACAKLYGEANYARLDHLTVTMAHPDALAALLSGGRGSITAHFGQSPFQDEELKHAQVHTVITSQEILGGLATSELLATTTAFRDANPVLYKAVLAALEDAQKIITGDKRRAAQIYIEAAQSRDSPEAVEKIISGPQVAYSIVPNGVMTYANFMHKIGRIKQRPEKWSDIFFPEMHDRPGS